MNCLSSFVKYVLSALNVIFLLGGVLLIVIGSVVLGDMGHVSSFEQAINTQALPICTIVLGCIIFIISFVGFCGTCRSNACCTTTYAVFMFILFILQLALSVWIFVWRENFLETMRNVVSTAWDENNDANHYPMDAIQLGFKCCGKVNYEDYISLGQDVPASCCGYSNRTVACPSTIYMARPGCSDKFVDFWSSNMSIISWSGIGICIFELVIFMIAVCLAKQMRSE